MAIRCFIPGTHYSVPSLPNKIGNDTIWELRFHKSLLHWFDVPEWDHDWRKALGFKKNFFNPRKSACMIGFRPNQERLRSMEICPYWNIDKENFYPGKEDGGPPAPILQLEFKENSDWSDTVYCRISINSPIFTWSFYDNEKRFIAEYSINLKTSGDRFWEIDPYYGGQAKAKSGMKLFLGKTKSLEHAD